MKRWNATKKPGRGGGMGKTLLRYRPTGLLAYWLTGLLVSRLLTYRELRTRAHLCMAPLAVLSCP